MTNTKRLLTEFTTTTNARINPTLELVNVLEQDMASGKGGHLAHQLVQLDLVILDELGYLSFLQAGGALLDRLTQHRHILKTRNDSHRSGTTAAGPRLGSSRAGSRGKPTPRT